MRLIGASIVLAMMVCAVSAVAQTAPFKCAAPGTIVEFSDGQRTTWVGQEGNFCRLQQKRRDGTEVLTNWFAPASSLAADGSQTWADQLKPWTLWPLSAGKKIEGRYDGPSTNAGGSGSWTHKIVIEKVERITTKAGTFDTFVVAFEQDGISHRWKSVLRSWYAPVPGVSVKFDYSDSQSQKISAEAVSIKP
ncbi:MAG: hypothetical protein ACT4O6_01305 [Reyranella sp.]